MFLVLQYIMDIKDTDTIFITGACGFVGQYVIQDFLESTNFNLLLNCRKDPKKIKDSRISYTSADLYNADEISALFETRKIDAVIHLSAMARVAEGEKSPNEAFNVNYVASGHLLNLSEKYQVKKFIFISSDLVRNCQSLVGITKFLSEADIQNGIHGETQKIILRLPNVSWTPGSVHLIFERLLKEGKTITITHPDMSRRFITGEEAASYIRYVLKNGKNKECFVINKPPEKITDLARKMMQEKGMNIDLSFIGMRPNEKLVEEVYVEDEITNTTFNDLALLKDQIPIEDSRQALIDLQSKPGFTIKISSAKK